MKRKETIQKRIDQRYESIEKIKGDDNMEPGKKKSAIYKMQMLIRELKWVLKN